MQHPEMEMDTIIKNQLKELTTILKPTKVAAVNAGSSIKIQLNKPKKMNCCK
jgi:hypothetical protein